MVSQAIICHCSQPMSIKSVSARDVKPKVKGRKQTSESHTPVQTASSDRACKRQLKAELWLLTVSSDVPLV